MRVCSVLVALTSGLTLVACGGRVAPGPRAAVECVPYARQISGIQLHGDADGWWEAAAGRYPRSPMPAPGSVLVFRATGRLPHGHVSVVSVLRAPREILVDQANWVHDRLGRNDPVVDVSPGNDWSAVRVWWAPAGQFGVTIYPTFGFIRPTPLPGGLLAEAQ